MDKKILIDKLKAMSASPSSSDVLKQAVKVYLSSLAFEQIAAKNLITVLEDEVVDIDEMIKTAQDTEQAIKYFGVEGAKLFAANAEALKASGAKYCNCFACTTALEILENKNVLLA